MKFRSFCLITFASIILLLVVTERSVAQTEPFGGLNDYILKAM